MKFDIYEDEHRMGKQDVPEQHSPYCDLVYYESSVTPGLRLAMLVKKPAKPSYILANTHGWHMTLAPFKPMDEPSANQRYLSIQVDMRGRAYSTGAQDCGGLELIDIFDAVNAAKRLYADYILDPDIVYFEGGSGGGGNAFSLAGKFPDMFSSVTALAGMSDYAVWYNNDADGEFRDEMDVWLGASPKDAPELYASRSGVTTVENLTSPMYIAHGNTDERVPVCHSRDYVGRALGCGKGALITYDELDGVGDRAHWGKATDSQLDLISYGPEALRLRCRKPVFLPARGVLVMAGYLYTKHFHIMLSDIGRMCRIKYDLLAKTVEFIGEPPCPYTIKWL